MLECLYAWKGKGRKLQFLDNLNFGYIKLNIVLDGQFMKTNELFTEEELTKETEEIKNVNKIQD